MLKSTLVVDNDIQSQIVSLLTYRGQKIFRAGTGHYYTHHSGRNFMPSATAVLGSSKSDWDILGGWSAEGRERYSRAAKYNITNVQKAASQSFTTSNLDPPGEAHDIDALGNFLKSCDVSDKEILRVKTLLLSRTFTDVQRDDTMEAPSVQVELDSGELAPDVDFNEELSMTKKASKEKQQVWNRGRSDLLGATTSKPGMCFEPSLNLDIIFLFGKATDQSTARVRPVLYVAWR